MDYVSKSGDKTEILSKLDMKFTWVDCETGEKDENYFGANGQNDFEKGFGSALTYGERYFLLKYFHIATDEDDIDNPDRKTSAPIAVAPPISTAKPPLPNDRFEKALEGIKGGTVNKNALDGFELTKEQKAKLLTLL